MIEGVSVTFHDDKKKSYKTWEMPGLIFYESNLNYLLHKIKSKKMSISPQDLCFDIYAAQVLDHLERIPVLAIGRFAIAVKMAQTKFVPIN